jgi:hypothetical protein
MGMKLDITKIFLREDVITAPSFIKISYLFMVEAIFKKVHFIVYGVFK